MWAAKELKVCGNILDVSFEVGKEVQLASEDQTERSQIKLVSGASPVSFAVFYSPSNRR